MKKYSTLKRLAAGAISAMMVFTSISAVFAAETTTAQTVTVEKERVLIGEVNGKAGKFTDNLYAAGNPGTNATIDEDGTVNLQTSVPVYNPIYRNVGSEDNDKITWFNKARNLFGEYDKYIFSFDISTNNPGSGTENGNEPGWIIFRGQDLIGTDNDEKNIFDFTWWNDHFKFKNLKLNNDASADFNVNDNMWHHVEYAVYLPNKDATTNSGTKIQVYVDDKLVREATTTLTFNQLIPQKMHMCCGSGTIKYKNMKYYLANDEDVAVNRAAYKEFVIDKLDKNDYQQAVGNYESNIMRQSTNSSVPNYQVTDNGIIFQPTVVEGHIVTADAAKIKKYFTGDDKDLYKDYIFSFDAKIPTTTETAQVKFQDFRWLSTSTDGQHNYLSGISFYNNTIVLYNGFNGTGVNVPGQYAGTTVRVDMKVEPKLTITEKPIVTWYINGKKAHSEELNISQVNTSYYGFMECMYAYKVDTTKSVELNNFKLSVTKKSAHPDKAFNANVTKGENSLSVVFDKDIANENYITKNSIVVKANGKTAVDDTAVAYDTETKTATITLPENSNADWYSVELPDVLTSTDGVYLTNNIVSTPHFSVDNAKIDVDSVGNHKLNITYTNTLNEQQSVMTMIAAYDTDGKLVKVDVKSYNVAVNGTVTTVGDIEPTIQTDLTDVRGYIWGANNCPIYNVVTLPEVK